MFYWVTKGKEIENYLSKQAIETMNGVTIKKRLWSISTFSRFHKRILQKFL